MKRLYYTDLHDQFETQFRLAFFLPKLDTSQFIDLFYILESLRHIFLKAGPL